MEVSRKTILVHKTSRAPRGNYLEVTDNKSPSNYTEWMSLDKEPQTLAEKFAEMRKHHNLLCDYILVDKGEKTAYVVDTESYEELMNTVDLEKDILVVNMVHRMPKKKSLFGKTIAKQLWRDEHDSDFNGYPKTPEFMLAKAKFIAEHL